MEHFRFILSILKSRKFWVLLAGALATLGLDIPAEWQALAIFLAAVVFAYTTALEDAALKSGGVTIDLSRLDDDE